ncbi:MAG: hypothetical protein IJY28_07140 [Clostridia bacterium]|nr:hypothetical protein [Clostridia bacterium]
MSFLKDLSKTVSYAVDEAVSRAKELTGVVKLNTAIRARQYEIDKAYAAIGRAVFAREAADPESPAAELCAKVLANQEAIASMQQQIADLKQEASEERKARSESVCAAKEAVEDIAEDVAEAVEEVAEDIAGAVEEAAEEKAE